MQDWKEFCIWGYDRNCADEDRNLQVCYIVSLGTELQMFRTNWCLHLQDQTVQEAVLRDAFVCNLQYFVRKRVSYAWVIWNVRATLCTDVIKQLVNWIIVPAC